MTEPTSADPNRDLQANGSPQQPTGSPRDIKAITEEAEHHERHGSGRLRKPQFELRTLLVFVLVISVLLAIYVRFGGLAAGVATLLALAVFGHVAGNAIGSKLRDQRGDEGKRRGENSSPRSIRSQVFAPPTKLSTRKSLGWPMIVFTLIGGLLSTFAGMGLFAVVLGESRRLNLLLVGGLAIGVLGAIASFAAFSFLHVTSTALQQAVTEPKTQTGRAQTDRSHSEMDRSG